MSDESEIRRIEELLPKEPAKLKFSEAMRIGASKRPQCRHTFFASGGSCAVGAIAEGLGFREGAVIDRFSVIDFFAEVGRELELRTANDAIVDKTGCGIPHLNDLEGWTREEIADLLEELGY